MKYEVIARKFRPQVFEDVVGQAPIVQTLQNAISMDRIGHAYLFSGPRGVGKTTTARLLAKSLNCSQGPTGTPCNECDSCLEVSRGQSIDVLEIDAASNTGVDSIRELRENARYSPSRDRFKIFIIDEVHMLSTSAFNALLKILEEPPTHVAFIMATTERHKLPATILSRCQQFVFRTIPPAEIQEHLGKIAEREHVQIGGAALEYIVKAAEGSMRDAQSLLDQVIAFGGQNIADEDVRDVLGFIPADLLDQAVEGIISRDARKMLTVVEVVVEQGLNLQQFVRELLSRVRDLLLVKLNLEDKILGSEEDRARLSAQAESVSEQDLIRFSESLLQLDNTLRFTSEQRFHLEVGSIKLTKIGHLRDIEDVIQELRTTTPDAREKKVRTESHASAGSPRRSSAAAATQARRDAPTVQAPDYDAPKSRRRPPAPSRQKKHIEGGDTSEPMTNARSSAPTDDVEWADRYKRQVGSLSETTALYLERVEVVSPQEGTLEIRVPNQAVQAALGNKDHVKVLETAAAELLSQPVSISFSMKPESGNVSDTEPDSSIRESAEKETLVQSFVDVFRGEIAHVKDTKKAEEGSH